MMPPIGARTSGCTRHRSTPTISYVGSAGKGTATTTSITVSYSPTNGNYVVGFVAVGAVISGVSCSDSSSNSLTAGPSNNLGSVIYGNSFYYKVPSAGITSFTFSWTGSGNAWVNVVEYSGVVGVNASLSGNTTSGATASCSQTCTTLVNNSYLVVGFLDTSSSSWTSPTGNLRISNTTTPSSGRSAIMDNTVATAGSVTCAVTKSVAADWLGLALELNP